MTSGSINRKRKILDAILTAGAGKDCRGDRRSAKACEYSGRRQGNIGKTQVPKERLCTVKASVFIKAS